MKIFDALQHTHRVLWSRALTLIGMLAFLFLVSCVAGLFLDLQDEALLAFGHLGLIVIGAPAVSTLIARELRGERPGPMRLLKDTVRRGPFASINALIAGLVGLLLGFCVVPGAMVVCAMALVVPLSMSETGNPFLVMRRSAELTRHFRWPLFGLFVISVLVSGVSFSLLDGSPESEIMLMPVFTLLWLYAQSLLTVIYHELSAFKDGIAPASLGASIEAA